MTWWIWVGIAALAVIGEAATLSLVLASVALAALAAAASSAATPVQGQVGVFVIVAIVLIVAVRPFAFRLLPRFAPEQGQPRIGPAARHGIVVDRVDQRGGQVRVGRGEFWSARAEVPGVNIDSEREVEIVGMDGLTALVRPVEPAESAAPVGLDPDASFFGLSPRELEVLALVSAGLSNQEIADRLVLSPRTVHHHVSNILGKMGVDSRVDAVRLAIQAGVSPDTDG